MHYIAVHRSERQQLLGESIRAAIDHDPDRRPSVERSAVAEPDGPPRMINMSHAAQAGACGQRICGRVFTD
jgi:hypothetical protein